MKIIARFQIALAALSVFVSMGGVASATGYVNDADIQLINASIDKLNTYVTSFSDSSLTVDQVITSGKDAQSSLSDLKSHSFSGNLGDTYTQGANALKQDASMLISDIDTIDTDLQTNDISKANTDAQKLNTDVDTFNNDEATLNAGVDAHNAPVKHLAVGYLVLLVAAILLSIGSFIWGARRSQFPAVRHARMTIAKLSLAPVIGAAITFATFVVATHSGGMYFIAWGPIGLGLIVYVSAVVRYLKDRPKLMSTTPTMTQGTVPLPMQVGIPVQPAAPMLAQPVYPNQAASVQSPAFNPTVGNPMVPQNPAPTQAAPAAPVNPTLTPIVPTVPVSAPAPNPIQQPFDPTNPS